MKFVCHKCDELVDSDDAIVMFAHAIGGFVGTSIYVYCSKCYEEMKSKGLSKK